MEKWRAFTGIATVLVCLALVWGLTTLALRHLRIIGFIDYPYREAKFRQIFTKVQSGEFVADSSGVVTLPRGFKELVVYDQIYVTRRRELLMVLFPIWTGKGSNIKGYLFCNRKLKTTDLADPAEGQPERVTVHSNGLWGGPKSPPEYRVPPSQRLADLSITEYLPDNVYKVLNDD